ncbi:MAG: elongation factor 4 [Armatimonadetes bacterium]|nr:elongation factor 4 [Armatimonadota bacterium]
MNRIRNFCIIAPIDHGKSTLADRILEITGAVRGDAPEQMLDAMELERERGITIKMTAVRLAYRAKDGQEYQFNLIDTPGHVDFTYEVSRSLAACEGAILVVDATQGVEAQTIANAAMAIDQGLEIVPVINKMDIAHADAERTKEQIEQALAIDASGAVLCSAKTGEGVEDVLEAVVHRIPPPSPLIEQTVAGKAGPSPGRPLRALIFDSHFDSYRGVVAYVRVFDGRVTTGDRIRMTSTAEEFEVAEVGCFFPEPKRVDVLDTGEVGYVIAGMKEIGDAGVGDTITLAENPAKEALPGYRKAKPMVFCGLYPTDGDHYQELRDAIEKLQLNDAALHFEPETSDALGFGFRCGFLGLLHMDIARERLEREFGLDLILTAPSVKYAVFETDGTFEQISNPSRFPPSQRIAHIEEPAIKAIVMVPQEYVGAVMKLCKDRRGVFEKMEYPSPERAVLYYTIPLSEILLDFYDKLKSHTRGYASFDYEFTDYVRADLVKVDMLLNGNPVDALSFIAHRDEAYSRAKSVVGALRKEVPKQQFEVRIQAAIGAKVIASETIKPFRKDVTAKCYGGDITRKRKLLERQKAGKKRMKNIGTVEVPQEAFLSVLKVTE